MNNRNELGILVPTSATWYQQIEITSKSPPPRTSANELNNRTLCTKKKKKKKQVKAYKYYKLAPGIALAQSERFKLVQNDLGK